ncbi:hypothetical protein Tco_0446487 [Tanacetum coccineum]
MDKFLWVNASVAPIAMEWFTGKDFPRDSAVDGMDGDMVLETLLNDNPTQIRRYPKESLVLIALSNLWHAPTARPTFYDENDEDEASGPYQGAGKKSVVSNKPLSKKGHLVVKPPLSSALEFVFGSFYETTDDLAFFGAGSKQLVSKESSKVTVSLSSASTQSQPLVHVRSGSPSSHVSKRILGITIALVEDSAETPWQTSYGTFRPMLTLDGSLSTLHVGTVVPVK